MLTSFTPPTPGALLRAAMAGSRLHLDAVVAIGREAGLDVARSTVHDWARRGPRPRDGQSARQLLVALGWAADEVNEALGGGDPWVGARGFLRAVRHLEGAPDLGHGLEIALAWLRVRPSLVNTAARGRLEGDPGATGWEGLRRWAELQGGALGLGRDGERELLRLALGAVDPRFPWEEPSETAARMLRLLRGPPLDGARRVWVWDGWTLDRQGTRRQAHSRVASVRLDGEGRPTELLLPGYGTADLPSSSFSTPQGVLPIRVEVRGAGVAIAALDQGFAWVRP